MGLTDPDGRMGLLQSRSRSRLEAKVGGSNGRWERFPADVRADRWRFRMSVPSRSGRLASVRAEGLRFGGRNANGWRNETNRGRFRSPQGLRNRTAARRSVRPRRATERPTGSRSRNRAVPSRFRAGFRCDITMSSSKVGKSFRREFASRSESLSKCVHGSGAISTSGRITCFETGERCRHDELPTSRRLAGFRPTGTT